MDSVCGPVPDELSPGSVSLHTSLSALAEKTAMRQRHHHAHGCIVWPSSPWDSDDILLGHQMSVNQAPDFPPVVKQTLWVSSSPEECSVAGWVTSPLRSHFPGTCLGHEGLNGHSLQAETLLICSMSEMVRLPYPPPYCDTTSLDERINSAF